QKAPEALPLLEKLVSSLIPDPTEIVEAEKRSRSVIIAGVPEKWEDSSPSQRQAATEEANVFIRRSLTSEELEKERKLRARARELNEGLPNGERLYVVFRQQVIVRKDRKNRRGGGICALLLSHLSFKLVQFDSSSFSADVLCFDIIGDILCYTRFVLVYRPPNHSVFEDDELCGLLSDLCSVPLNVVLLGDFNLDIDWSTDLCMAQQVTSGRHSDD
ncbi:hypothetical protein GCK32_005488, partial [Trichostrongylus colubriformis]